jgi:carbon storage regulator CsrA
MKTFSQNIGETVFIDGDISVTIIDIREDEVVLAIDAPEWMEVREEDVLEALAPARPR